MVTERRRRIALRLRSCAAKLTEIAAQAQAAGLEPAQFVEAADALFDKATKIDRLCDIQRDLRGAKRAHD